MEEKNTAGLIPVKAQLKNYLGLEEEYSSFKKSKVVIFQAPYDKTTTYIWMHR